MLKQISSPLKNELNFLHGILPDKKSIILPTIYFYQEELYILLFIMSLILLQQRFLQVEFITLIFFWILILCGLSFFHHDPYQVDYWVKSVLLRAPKAPMMFVATHIDERGAVSLFFFFFAEFFFKCLIFIFV